MNSGGTGVEQDEVEFFWVNVAGTLPGLVYGENDAVTLSVSDKEGEGFAAPVAADFCVHAPSMSTNNVTTVAAPMTNSGGAIGLSINRTAGISFNIELDEPDVTIDPNWALVPTHGQYAILQLAYIDTRKYWGPSASTWEEIFPNVWQLDGAFPPIGYSMGGPGRTGTFTTNAALPFTLWDSPGVLTEYSGSSGPKYIYMSDDFKDYIMYKPNGLYSHWVPTDYATWAFTVGEIYKPGFLFGGSYVPDPTVTPVVTHSQFNPYVGGEPDWFLELGPRVPGSKFTGIPG